MGRLNWDRAFAMEQAADDAGLLEELLIIFKDTFTGDLAAMEEGLASDDSEKVSAAAHSILGAAASLGLHTVYQTAKEIETLAKTGRLSRVQEDVVLLGELLEEVRAL